jgi:Transmembrane domain of unknown function (DUF3566)
MAEMTIKRFGVFSVAKMQSLVMFVIGLVIGVIYGLAFMIFGAAISAMAPSGEGQAVTGVSTIIIGLVFMIAFPIIYAIIGFIIGCIWALVYNMAAGIVGGIKFELESVNPGYAAPPPPQQWAGNPYPAQ